MSSPALPLEWVARPRSSSRVADGTSRSSLAALKASPAAKTDVEHAGGNALLLPLDVADARAVDEAAARVVAEWKSIDVWMNCAMVTVVSLAHEMSAEEYRRVTEVT